MIRQRSPGRTAVVWILAALLFIAIAIWVPVFFSLENLSNVLLQSAAPAIVAIGMTAVIVSGHIDLSVGSIAALSGVILARLCLAGMPSAAATLLALVFGCASGYLGGTLVARFGVPAFVSSLAIMGAARGVSLILSGGRGLSSVGSVATWMGSGRVLDVPVPVAIAIAVLLLVHIGLNHSVPGQNLYAVGGNPKAAWIAGIGGRRLVVGAHVVCSALAALAGVVIGGRLGSAQPLAGNLYELDAITAVVIGGGGLVGGRGSALGSVLAACFLAATRNAMVLANLSPYLHDVLIGALLIAVVLTDVRVRQSDEQWLAR